MAKPATVILTKSAGGPSTVIQTTSAGDMNGDGFADLIVQWAYSVTVPQTELRLFFGGTIISSTPDPGPLYGVLHARGFWADGRHERRRV